MARKLAGGKRPGPSNKGGAKAGLPPNGARIRIFGADNPDAFRGIYFDGVTRRRSPATIRALTWFGRIAPALTLSPSPSQNSFFCAAVMWIDLRCDFRPH